MAFEMAQQLHQLGQEVAFVGLFDTYFPWSRAKWVREGIRFRGRRFMYFMFMCFRGRLGYLRKWWRRRQKRIALENYLPTEVQALWKSFQVAARKYRPRSYAGRVTLFKVKKPDPFRSLGQSEAWRRCVGGGLDVREVPGTHGSMFYEPHLSVLAKELKECLDRAQRRHGDNTWGCSERKRRAGE